MKKGIKTVCYDEELGIEAYWFEGIIQPFPNHFHDYYVIGFQVRSYWVGLYKILFPGYGTAIYILGYKYSRDLEHSEDE